MEASFPDLTGLVSFVTNSKLLQLSAETATSTSALISTLSDLLLVASVEHLEIKGKISVPATELGTAISQSSIRSLILSTNMLDHGPKVPPLFFTAAGPSLELLEFYCLDLDLPGDMLSVALGKCVSLTKLKIKECISGGSTNARLVAWICRLRDLESLTFYAFPLDKDIESAERLIEGLRGLQNLRRVKIGRTRIGAKGGKAIGGLAAMGRLRKLNFSGNGGVGEEFVDGFLAAGTRCCALQALDLTCSQIGPEACAKLAQLLARAPRLVSFQLSYNPIGDAAAALLGKSLAKRRPEVLSVSVCKLTPGGIAALFSPLRRNALRVIRISDNNRPGDAGVEAVCDCMERGQGRLEELLAGKNSITGVGASRLAKLLRRDYDTMRIIDMNEDVIGPDAAVAVLDALAVGAASPMDRINLDHCYTGNPGAKAAALLITRRGCRDLRLRDDNISVQGVTALAAAVTSEPRPTPIDLLILRDNPIPESGMMLIADTVIRRNVTVAALDISNCRVSTEAGKAIALALRERGQGALREIRLTRTYCEDGARQEFEEVLKWEQDSKQQGSVIYMYKS